MTDIDRAILRLLIQGNDGGWDYYPFGFKKPGYRTDAALLDEVVRIERGGPKLALIGIAAIAILLYIVFQWTVRSGDHPDIGMDGSRTADALEGVLLQDTK